MACVAYSSSFLSKICRNQYAFRVVLLLFLPSRCGAVHVFLQSAVFPMTCHHNTVCALCFLLHFRSKLSWLMVFVRIRVRRLTYLHWNARKKTSINSDWLPSCFGMNALHPAVFPPNPFHKSMCRDVHRRVLA